MLAFFFSWGKDLRVMVIIPGQMLHLPLVSLEAPNFFLKVLKILIKGTDYFMPKI